MLRRIKGESLFLIYALVFGLLLVFAIPPLNAPDETSHFINAYAVSKGQLWGEIDNEQLVRKVPERINDFADAYPGGILWNYDQKYGYKEVIAESQSREGLGEITNFAGVVVSPVGYLVSGTGMAFGSLLGAIFQESAGVAQPYNQMIFGRIANLLFFAFMTYYALKMIPCFKRTMLLLAMMPMMLFQGASLSYDAILIPVTFLFFAIVAKLMSERDTVIQPKEIATVLFCVFFMAGIKQIYAPLLLMLLMIPRKKYGSTRRMVYCIAAVIVVAVLAYLPQMIHNGIASRAVKDANAVAKDEQGVWIRNNLSQIPSIFIHTFRAEMSFYLESFWGLLGWLDTPISRTLEIIGLSVIAGMAIIDICSFSVCPVREWWKRLLPLTAVVSIVTGVMYMMYREYTPLTEITGTIGGDIVKGVQGRYFIPIFMPLCLVFSNRLLSLTARKRKVNEEKVAMIQRRLDYAAYLWSFMCGVFTVLFVMLRYWI